MQQDYKNVNSHKSKYSIDRGIEYTSERQVKYSVYNHVTNCCKTIRTTIIPTATKLLKYC